MSQGGLSNRVMNMKFMQKAEDTKQIRQREEEEKKIHDLSEWVLPNSQKLLKIALSKPKIDTVGYGTIMSNGTYNYLSSTTRRTWGDVNKNKLQVEEIKEESKEPPLDLNTMWKKRKLDSPTPTSGKKKKRSN
ncbi:hypothetical protein SBY92_004281 [Candida maltosa Xu316]